MQNRLVLVSLQGADQQMAGVDGMARGVAPRYAGVTSSAIGAVAVIWFVLLSGWLGVTPGSRLVTHQNVLFNSDMNLWIEEMVQGHPPFTRAVHPLQTFLWRPPCQDSRQMRKQCCWFKPDPVLGNACRSMGS